MRGQTTEAHTGPGVLQILAPCLSMPLDGGQGRSWLLMAFFFRMSRGIPTRTRSSGVCPLGLWKNTKAAGHLHMGSVQTEPSTWKAQPEPSLSLSVCGKCPDRMISSEHFSTIETEALASEECVHAEVHVCVCVLCVIYPSCM